MSELLAHAARHQAEYCAATGIDDRKSRGQIFTPPEVARFMAGLLTAPAKNMAILDPGAGAGMLTAAVCERILDSPSPVKLHARLFETDSRLMRTLGRNLEHCEARLAEKGHEFTFVIHEEDFVLAAAPRFDGQERFFGRSAWDDVDAVIMNPPYFKVRKDSEHARLMDRIVHGQPNAYAFFLALAAATLRPGGELIAITPRSFCNGLYFRGFRKWFFERMSLDHIHLFESRTETFSESKVLQESVITKSHRLGSLATVVSVTQSRGKEIPEDLAVRLVRHDEVVDASRGEYLVKIPVSEADCEAVRKVESLPCRFEETGLRISTGPVVMFRAVELVLREPNGEPVAPLLMPHHVRPFQTRWPGSHPKHPTHILDCEAARKRRLLIPSGNYVLLKRFSSKEERRRLTAGCLLRSDFPAPWIGLENHLNYVYHADRELTGDEAFGVALLFNSSILDRYFRVISGNTQINATEIRNLHFPPLDILATMGRKARDLSDVTPRDVEKIVLKGLHGATCRRPRSGVA